MISKKLTVGWTVEEVCDRLETMTVAEIKEKLLPFCLDFLDGEKTWLQNQTARISLAAEEAYQLTASKRIVKDFLIKTCAPAFLHPACFARFQKYLPKDTQIILQDVALNGDIDQDEVEKKFHIKGAKKGTQLDYRKRTIDSPSPSLSFFMNNKLRSGYFYASANERIFYYLHDAVRELILHLLFPEPPKVNTYIPDPSKDAFVFETVAALHEELPGLLIHLQQKPLKITKKGKVSFASVRSIAKKLKIREFFPEAQDPLLKHIRAKAVIGLLALTKGPDSKDLPKLIKKLFEFEFFRYFHVSIQLLDYINGFGKVKAYDLKNLNKTYLEILKGFPQGEWLVYEDIELRLKAQSVSLSPINSYVSNGLYVTLTDEKAYNGKREQYLGTHRAEKMITWPTFRAMIFIMASWGILDIIYDEPDLSELCRTANSPYDQIKAIRITNLGAYVLGNVDSYEFNAKPPFSLELSDDSLSILLTDGDYERAAMALSSFAKPIGNSRFFTDANLFLNDCKKASDLEVKITLFESIFSKELPEAWKDFFHEISQKVNPIDEEFDFTLFRLDPKNKQLLKLIARDSILKRLCLKAEGYLILVPQKDVSKFRKRLQAFGYLLE